MSTRLSRRVLPETKEQQGVISWAIGTPEKPGMVAYHGYEDLALLHMVNNGNYGGDYRMWNWLRSMGLLPGLPDLHLPIARQSYVGWWCEMKRTNFKATHKPTKTRERQIEVQELLRAQGHYVLDGATAQTAIKSLEWYVKLPKLGMEE